MIQMIEIIFIFWIFQKLIQIGRDKIIFENMKANVTKIETKIDRPKKIFEKWFEHVENSKT